MSYIAAEDVAKAKEMDLLTYLRNYEPQELVHVSGNTYCTREHDSLRISNGKWCWFSQGIGGRSALDYLIKVKGIPFTQAAEIILGREAEKPPVFYRQKERKHTNLLMPELSETTDCVEKYLQDRGIHPVIIRYCLDNKLLFESADYHNAMFVGYDKDGKARYGALRSTVSSYKGELTGSDKHFSFFLEGKPNAEHIHVFESAIDLLSFATLALLAGRDWKSETYLSLAGVFQTKRENVVPVALSRFLDEHPSVRKIHLHAGQGDANPSVIAQGLVKRMLAEIRSYGVGLIIADQSPRKVSTDVVALTDMKMIFRLVESVDKQIIGDSTNMTDVQIQRMAKLKPGEAFLFFNKLEEPEEVITPDYRLENNISITLSDDGIRALSTYWNNKAEKLRPYPECQCVTCCSKTCDYARRVLAREVARRIFVKNFRSDTKDFEILKRVFGKISKMIQAELNDEKFTPELLSCVKVHLWRRIKYGTKIQIRDTQIENSLRK